MTAGSTLMHKDTSENSEDLKSGSSCNLPQTNYRLPKNTEEVALQAPKATSRELEILGFPSHNGVVLMASTTTVGLYLMLNILVITFTQPWTVN
jgi:hypothetical protein